MYFLGFDFQNYAQKGSYSVSFKPGVLCNHLNLNFTEYWKCFLPDHENVVLSFNFINSFKFIQIRNEKKSSLFLIEYMYSKRILKTIIRKAFILVFFCLLSQKTFESRNLSCASFPKYCGGGGSS